MQAEELPVDVVADGAVVDGQHQEAAHQRVCATEKKDDLNSTMTLTDCKRPMPTAMPSADDSVVVSKLYDLSPKATPPQAGAEALTQTRSLNTAGHVAS